MLYYMAVEFDVALATQPMSGESHPGIVVVVDDEPLVLRGLTRSLERLPFEIVPCSTAREVMDHVSVGHVRVVVSDISMGEMSGIELLRNVREHDPDLPVVLVTGCPEIGTATKALEYGAFRYLIKPVDVDEFNRHGSPCGAAVSLGTSKAAGTQGAG